MQHFPSWQYRWTIRDCDSSLSWLLLWLLMCSLVPQFPLYLTLKSLRWNFQWVLKEKRILGSQSRVNSIRVKSIWVKSIRDKLNCTTDFPRSPIRLQRLKKPTFLSNQVILSPYKCYFVQFQSCLVGQRVSVISLSWSVFLLENYLRSDLNLLVDEPHWRHIHGIVV